MSPEIKQELDNKVIYLKNRINAAIQEYALNKGLESVNDISNFSQSKWYAVLIYIYHTAIEPNKELLKADIKYIKDVSNNISKNPRYSNQVFGAYNIYVLDQLYDYYIYLCNENDKGITPYGYCLFTGVDNDTLASFEEGGVLLSIEQMALYKKIYAAYEQSAEAKLWTNKNPVAVMAITNRRFGWNMPGVGRDQRGRSALGAAELPQLDQKP